MPMRLATRRTCRSTGKPGHSEGVAENYVRRLAADPGQLHEFVHRLRHLAGVAFDHLTRHADERSRLGTKEPGGLNLRLEFAWSRRGRVRPGPDTA